MRLIITAISLFLTGTICMSQSCNKNVKPCGSNVICTEIFAMVTLHITDKNGQDVILNDAYTVRKSTGEEIHIEQSLPANGSYIVLDDGYRKKLENSADTFTFIGMKDKKEVVRELYVISADCCHINKVSGNNEVTTP